MKILNSQLYLFAMDLLDNFSAGRFFVLDANISLNKLVQRFIFLARFSNNF